MAAWLKQLNFVIASICLMAGVSLLAGCGDYLAEVGGSCSYHADCDERCVSGGRFPGGMCTISCDDEYDCPVGTFCIDRNDGICLPECDRHHDCRRNYVCSDERNHGSSGRSPVCVGD